MCACACVHVCVCVCMWIVIMQVGLLLLYTHVCIRVHVRLCACGQASCSGCFCTHHMCACMYVCMCTVIMQGAALCACACICTLRWTFFFLRPLFCTAILPYVIIINFKRSAKDQNGYRSCKCFFYFECHQEWFFLTFDCICLHRQCTTHILFLKARGRKAFLGSTSRISQKWAWPGLFWCVRILKPASMLRRSRSR